MRLLLTSTLRKGAPKPGDLLIKGRLRGYRTDLLPNTKIVPPQVACLLYVELILGRLSAGSRLKSGFFIPLGGHRSKE
uniref:Uncharacterized protein n=1 Tax=Picea glauca TaxID=3330 RepID=A0A101M4Z5_PICGL|nr:hypothetical protein ABT39_MTgene946 [Picea glauca]QHR86388.1 hypothetical protein Q903MT_gene387 [Picea sitchensis]